MVQKPNSSSLFVGRKDILDKLWKIFIPCAERELILRRSCLLWGTGGIGKTQICLKFIEELSDRLSHVFWVDASSVESITMSLRGLSNISAARASCLDGSVESVLQWMSGIQEEWLIVFDNADDLPVCMVEKFIPPGNRGNILITSRNRSMGRVISFENVIEINEMEEVDAITLLLKTSYLDASAEHIEAAKNIVTELGCMPLAVDQAGAYIEAGRCSIDKYLQHFLLHRQTLMSDATFKGASNYDRTVYGTWDLSFKEIKKRASGQSNAGYAQAAYAAILILQICAFYHHSNISKDIFRSAAEESREHVVDSEVAKKLPMAKSLLDCTLLALDNNGRWDEFIFGQGIAVLLSFSLMKRDQSLEILSVHPLVHCWSREQISKNEQQRIYEMGSMILCSAVSQRLSSCDFGLRRLIYPHIKANESHGSQMSLTKKYYDDKWNNFIFVMDEIEQLGVQVLDMRKKVLGKEHSYTLEIMTYLARIYANQGKLNEAEVLEVQVLDIRKKMLGAEHSETLRSMGYLASIYISQGKWKEAGKLEVQVLEMRKKLLGAEHPDTLVSMGNLARIYVEKGNFNKAEQLEVQVLDMEKKLLGVEHPRTLMSMGNLASTYAHKGNFKEAEQLEAQVLDMRKKLLGAEHPQTLMSMGNLARIYANKGNFKKAEQLEIQVLNIEMELLGAEHPQTLMTMGNLSCTYSSQGKWRDAEHLEVQVMDMRKKLLGAEHPQTLRSMANLATTFASQGKQNEAEQLNVQVLDMRRMLLGAEHPDTLMSLGKLASIYADKGNFKEAEKLEVQVLSMRKKLLGAEHPRTLISMGNLASTYSSLGKWNEAEHLNVQVLNIRRKLLGEEHPKTLISMENLASIYTSQGKWNEAEQLEVQVLYMRKKQFGVEHPDTVLSMENLASIYSIQGKWDEAEQLEVKLLDMRKKLF